MVRCANGNLYTGITTDVERRFEEHQTAGKKAAKYLKGKGPLKLVWAKEIGSRSEALKAEYQVKKLSRLTKERLIAETHSLEELVTPLL